MKAYDVMTWGVVSVEADVPIKRAAQLMLDNKIGGLPVVDPKGNLVGFVSEDDLIHRTGWRQPVGSDQSETENLHLCNEKVDQIMTPAPYAITGDTPLEAIVEMMENHRIKHLPVVDEHRVIGMVSVMDLVQALVKSARVNLPRSVAADVREEALSE